MPVWVRIRLRKPGSADEVGKRYGPHQRCAGREAAAGLGDRGFRDGPVEVADDPPGTVRRSSRPEYWPEE